MLKKIFVSLLFCTIGFELRPILDTKAQKMTAVAVGAGALGTAIYCMKRETNESIIVRSKELILEINAQLDQTELFFSNNKRKDKQISLLFENRLLIIKEKLDSLFSIVKSRYESYIAFWNWTDQMKEMVRKMEKASQKINELLYEFSLQKAFEFVHDYQKNIQLKVDAFADNKSFVALLLQSKSLKKDLFEIGKKGISIQSELSVRTSKLDLTNKRIMLDLSLILSQLDFMQAVLKYSDCILSVNSSESLVRNARKVAGMSSSYPIKDFVGILKKDLQQLKKIDIGFESYVFNSVELLENILEEIVSSKEYAQEKQAFESYLQEQRKLQIAQDQARAAQDQADAAHRQAEALKEQNRIQKERNYIEYERNNIERNK